MKVTWTARARTRLAELHDYIAQDSKPGALAMVERLLDRSEALEVAPRSGARLQAPWRRKRHRALRFCHGADVITPFDGQTACRTARRVAMGSSAATKRCGDFKI